MACEGSEDDEEVEDDEEESSDEDMDEAEQVEKAKALAELLRPSKGGVLFIACKQHYSYDRPCQL